ncbi:hypothetical protein [Pseudomonas paracarnis]|uniref:hypothetical protein n=1 Tax=Pseudomonas paracarnis TaxID=2750625 RepID=UPI00191B930E|nr:hypothetical protein [Pseudomonas paracarnis]
MNNLVYYLSFYGERGGFLTPEELPKNYYSPGLFLLESEADGRYVYSYSFDAMDNGKRISLALVMANENNPDSTLYVVKTKHYGSFWFNLEKINPHLRYIGNKVQLKSHRDFSIVIPTDSDKLERVCHNFNFYFIGSALREDT